MIEHNNTTRAAIIKAKSPDAPLRPRCPRGAQSPPHAFSPPWGALSSAGSNPRPVIFHFALPACKMAARAPPRSRLKCPMISGRSRRKNQNKSRINRGGGRGLPPRILPAANSLYESMLPAQRPADPPIRHASLSGRAGKARLKACFLQNSPCEKKPSAKGCLL